VHKGTKKMLESRVRELFLEERKKPESQMKVQNPQTMSAFALAAVKEVMGEPDILTEQYEIYWSNGALRWAGLL